MREGRQNQKGRFTSELADIKCHFKESGSWVMGRFEGTEEKGKGKQKHEKIIERLVDKFDKAFLYYLSL